SPTAFVRCKSARHGRLRLPKPIPGRLRRGHRNAMMSQRGGADFLNTIRRRWPPRGSLSYGLPSLALLVCLRQLVAIAQTQDPAHNKDISARRAAETRSFTDAQIIDGFFKITFGAEFHTSGRIDRIRKFDVPVRAYVDNRARPDRGHEIGR